MFCISCSYCLNGVRLMAHFAVLLVTKIAILLMMSYCHCTSDSTQWNVEMSGRSYVCNSVGNWCKYMFTVRKIVQFFFLFKKTFSQTVLLFSKEVPRVLTFCSIRVIRQIGKVYRSFPFSLWKLSGTMLIKMY